LVGARLADRTSFQVAPDRFLKRNVRLAVHEGAQHAFFRVIVRRAVLHISSVSLE
jgi:hypothetical protein